MSAIFISHSSKDNTIATELKLRLSQQGHRSLFLDFDPENGIPAGQNWEQELYQQLRTCQAVIVLCSPHSTASPWVFAEITHAKSLGKHVFPIKIEACTIPSVLTERQILDLTGDKEGTYQQLWRGLKVAGLDPATRFDWDGSRPPYPGLLAFQEADAAIFFGRNKEIEDGLDLLRQLRRFGGARTVIVLGASGSGKSSFVRAGLVPRLRKNEEWFILEPFRPQEHPEGPFKGLAVVLANACKAYELPQPYEEIQRTLEQATEQTPADRTYLNGLLRDLRRVAGQPRATVLLVIDQLEEVLNAPDLPKAQRFVHLLRATLEDPQSPLILLCALRSDFLGKFQQDRTAKELHFSDLLLNPMSPDRFGAIIEQPAAKIGLRLEPGLTTAMVQDTRTDDALPLLAFTLRELYEKYGTDGRLDLEAYRDKLGGLAGAVAKAATAVFTARPLSREGEAALRRAFLHLVRVNEEGQPVRQLARWQDLPSAAQEVLERFVQARLLVARNQGAERIVEVAHEVIFRAWGQLTKWLDEDREFLLWRRRLQISLIEWDHNSRVPTLLLQGGRLTEAQQWLEQRKADLDDTEWMFIETSVQVAATQRRWRRTMITGVLGLILALAVYGTYTNWQAQVQAERAHASAIITVASSALASSSDPVVASLLIRESTKLPEPDGGLRVAHQAASLVMPISILQGHTDLVGSVAFSPDGQRVVPASDDKTARVWRADGTGEPVILQGHTNSVLSVAFSPDGQRVVTASGDKTARVWRVSWTGLGAYLREFTTACLSTEGSN